MRTGPAGDRFYAGPAKLPAGPHGSAIWKRSYSGPAALRGARNSLVLYKQVGVRGGQVPTSGYVAVPTGKPPHGGWPVVTWAHGTTGLADRCAPSRLESPIDRSINAPLQERWVRMGFAVVRTDYEGLGTPGVHPYLVGRSEGRAVLDMVRAARAVEPRLGRRVLVAGHSQGGHAALWASSIARRYTPELRLRGTLAFAPASGVAALVPFLKRTDSTALTALAAAILRGIDVAHPRRHFSSVLSDRAAELYPQTSTVCLPALHADDSFGGLALKDLVKQDADLGPVQRALAANEPLGLKIGGPIVIEQGTNDTTVFPATAERLTESLDEAGDAVTYKAWDGANHVTVLQAAEDHAAAFVRRRLRR